MGQPVVVEDGLELFHVTSTQVFLVLQSVFSGGLSAELRKAEENRLKIGIVESCHYLIVDSILETIPE